MRIAARGGELTRLQGKSVESGASQREVPPGGNVIEIEPKLTSQDCLGKVAASKQAG